MPTVFLFIVFSAQQCEYHDRYDHYTYDGKNCRIGSHNVRILDGFRDFRRGLRYIQIAYRIGAATGCDACNAEPHICTLAQDDRDAVNLFCTFERREIAHR